MASESPPPTPIHDRFSLHLPQAPSSPKKQIIVPSLPRTSKTATPTLAPNETAGSIEPAEPAPGPNPIAALTQPQHGVYSPQDHHARHPEPPAQDHGHRATPLFRAIVLSNERRCKALRASLKSFVKVASDAVDSMEERAACEAAVDASLDALSAGAALSDTLGSLWDKELRQRREEKRAREHRELIELQSVIANSREAMERLKSVEQYRKAFEAESRKYYDDLGKVSTMYADHEQPAECVTSSTLLEPRQILAAIRSRPQKAWLSIRRVSSIVASWKGSSKLKKQRSHSGCARGQELRAILPFVRA